MKNSITNKLKMYQTVSYVCAKHQAVWSVVPAFADAFLSFTDQVSLLKEQALIQDAAITGVAKQKAIVLKNVIEKAIVVSKALSALALKNIDSELLVRNIQSRSEWIRGNSLVRVDRLQHLMADVTANEAVLVDYGIDAAFIAELSVLIDEYTQFILKPRFAILERKHATDTMVKKIKNIDLILNGQMDKIVEVFRSENGVFVEQYFDARLIVDLKGKRRNSKNDDVSDGEVEHDSDDGDGLF